MTPTKAPTEAWATTLQRTNRWLAVAVALISTILIAGLAWLLACSTALWHT